MKNAITTVFPVPYYEVLEHPSFEIAVWHASKNFLPIIDRLAAVGMAWKLQKKAGTTFPKNSLYTFEYKTIKKNSPFARSAITVRYGLV